MKILFSVFLASALVLVPVAEVGGGLKAHGSLSFDPDLDDDIDDEAEDEAEDEGRGHSSNGHRYGGVGAFKSNGHKIRMLRLLKSLMDGAAKIPLLARMYQ